MEEVRRASMLDPLSAPRRSPGATDAALVSLWQFRQVRLREFGDRLRIVIAKADITGRAAQLAYYFFFSLFPMLIAASALLGLAAKQVGDLNQDLLAYLSKVIPPAGYQIVADTFHQTTHASSGGKVLVGALVALWSASAGTSAAQDALNSVYRVEESRPFWKSRLTAIGLTVVVGLLFVLAVASLFAGDKLIVHLNAGLGLAALIGIRLLTWPIAFSVAALGFALMYWKAPDVKDQRWDWITPGAAAGIVLWLLASLGLRIYLHYFDSYSVTYGSLGAVIVLLTWFYLSGLALLLGAAVNDTLREILVDRQQIEPESQKQNGQRRV